MEHWIKEINIFNIINISYGIDKDDPYYFRIFKHSESGFFERYSKVVEITFFGRLLILEF